MFYQHIRIRLVTVKLLAKINKLETMKRPNRIDYLTTNQMEYKECLNKYYNDLEEYVDKLEAKQLALCSVSKAFVCELNEVDRQDKPCKKQCDSCKWMEQRRAK